MSLRPDAAADPGDAALLGAVAAAFAPDRPARIGVALSGGGDSMALLHLALRVAAGSGQSVHAGTVDHGLRSGSAREAEWAGAAAIRLGASHDILRWQREAGSGNLQDQARRARFRLIGEWAASRGVDHVLLGHTADDQAETLLMRLARGAGLDGLSGMRVRWRDGPLWARPLLVHGRAELRFYLRHRGEAWSDDPSNDDLRFDRIRARRALTELAPLGIDADVLGHVARNLATAREALRKAAADAARDLATCEAGDTIFARTELLEQSAEIRRRLLIGALRFVAGGTYPPRAAAVEMLETAIRHGRDATLAGCLVTVAAGRVRMTREPAALRGIRCGQGDLWDGRWRIVGPHVEGAAIGALTADGLLHCPGWRETGLPRATLAASPALRSNGRLIAAPLAGLGTQWHATLAGDRDEFYQFLLSH